MHKTTKILLSIALAAVLLTAWAALTGNLTAKGRAYNQAFNLCMSRAEGKSKKQTGRWKKVLNPDRAAKTCRSYAKLQSTSIP